MPAAMRPSAFWRDAITGRRTSDEDLAEAVRIIERHDAVNATRERARHFAQRAIEYVPDSPPAGARPPWPKPPNSRSPAAN